MRFPNPFTPAAAGLRPVVEEIKPSGGDAEVAVSSEPSNVDNKNATTTEHGAVNDDESIVSEDAQHGIQRIQATLSVWSRNHLIAAYVIMFILHFIMSIESTILNSLTPYVTSAFAKHSLIPTTSILSNIIGGLSKLPLAKVLDIWGRPQGFALSCFVMTIGIIMMAGCNTVETYCAAQVFYAIGNNGVSYAMSIFVADTSHLKNRGLMIALMGSPGLVTPWMGGPAVESVLKTIGWRWGYGVFCIVQPIACFPLWALFAWNERKAEKAGLIPKHDSGRTTLQSLKYYAVEFDVVGLLLLSAGLALFLLAFSLYGYQAQGFAAPLIICFLVIGFSLIIVFAFYERFYAPVTFIPWGVFTDRTVLGVYVFAASLYVEWWIWDSYFQSFLLVVTNLSQTHTTYVTSIYGIGACISAFLAGVAIRWSGRIKWISLYYGIPLTILGIALMIKFREPGVGAEYIVMCQIFIAFAGGAMVVCEQIAAMAAVTQKHVAVVLAVESMFISVGSAIGLAVAAAMWTGIFPVKLAKYLPAEELPKLQTIYGDILVQMAYPMGSPARLAIQRAYAETQRYMLIGGASVLVVGWTAILFWRDLKVKDVKQVRGRVV